MGSTTSRPKHGNSRRIRPQTLTCHRLFPIGSSLWEPRCRRLLRHPVLLHAVVLFHGVLGHRVLLHGVLGHGILLHSVVLLHGILGEGSGGKRQAQRKSGSRNSEHKASTNGHWWLPFEQFRKATHAAVLTTIPLSRLLRWNRKSFSAQQAFEGPVGVDDERTANSSYSPVPIDVRKCAPQQSEPSQLSD